MSDLITFGAIVSVALVGACVVLWALDRLLGDLPERFLMRTVGRQAPMPPRHQPMEPSRVGPRPRVPYDHQRRTATRRDLNGGRD
jgi:hypothetical protein